MKTHEMQELEMRRRFSDRPEIPKPEVVEMFVSHSTATTESVEALLDVIEFEFSLPVGLMRPNDPIELIMAPITGNGWWSDITLELRIDSAHAGLLAHIEPRMKKLGMVIPDPDSGAGPMFKTLGDLALLWAETSSQRG